MDQQAFEALSHLIDGLHGFVAEHGGEAAGRYWDVDKVEAAEMLLARMRKEYGRGQG